MNTFTVLLVLTIGLQFLNVFNSEHVDDSIEAKIFYWFSFRANGCCFKVIDAYFQICSTVESLNDTILLYIFRLLWATFTSQVG